MYTKVTTLTQHLLKEGQQFAQAKGNFTLLMITIQDIGKIIAAHIKKSGLVDIVGQAGSQNTYGEDVQKLDEFTNKLFVDMLLSSGQVFAVGSEELPDLVYSEDKKGEYVVFFDPLDGSSNIDTNISIGSIFSIYHKSDNRLAPGRQQVAAGYIMYGPSVMLVYTSGTSVNGFTLDPAMGSFLLSHENIQIPKEGKIYAINEGNQQKFNASTKNYLQSLKDDGSYTLRYVGSMVGDLHRTLLKGGIFLYPGDTKNPQGKLRLLFEVNPMGFLVEHAGGMVTSQGENPLDIIPESISQTVPIVIGSIQEVEKYKKTIKQ